MDEESSLLVGGRANGGSDVSNISNISNDVKTPAAVLPLWGRYLVITIVATTVALYGYIAYPEHHLKTTDKRMQLVKVGKIKYMALNSADKETLFDEFKTDFGRKYDTTKEEKERYALFLTNLERFDARNEKEKKVGGTAVHGITQFADLSPGEFKKHFLGYVPPSDEAKAKADPKPTKVPKYEGLATMVDWSDRYTTSINNQGYCGSCWAFSAIQQVESDSIRKGLLTNNQKLSVQQLVSCDISADVPSFMTNYGCQGGNTETAFVYISYAGGVVLESDYPYTSYYATSSDCSSSINNYEVTISGYHTLSGEASMKDYVMSTGPLAVCMDATDWASYKGGIVSSCGTSVNHCVQVVGIDAQRGYWIVRNSWGTSWGINGYIYLQTDQNMCQIAYDPHYVDPVAV